MDQFEVIAADRHGVTVRHRTDGFVIVYRFANDDGGRRVLQRLADEAPNASPEVLQAGAMAARVEAERLGLFDP